MKTLKILVSVIFAASASIALAEDSTNTYTTKTDAAGTSLTTETSRQDSVGKTGVTKSTADVKSVADPKGLMNAKTAQKHTERLVKPNGDYAESKTVQHANGTAEESTSGKNTAAHWTNKGQTTTTTETRSVDPVGLGNKETTAVTKEVDTNPNGTEKITTTKEVNGQTVSEETKVTH